MGVVKDLISSGIRAARNQKTGLRMRRAGEIIRVGVSIPLSLPSLADIKTDRALFYKKYY